MPSRTQGINNAVYRSGFATTQAAYDAAQRDLWPSLDRAEALLSSSRFLLGDKVTEADVRLFPTIIRFDSAYATLFRCSRRRIAGGYPNLQRWLREMHGLRMPGCGTGVKETIDVGRARESYFGQLFPLNPSGIVAEGPSVRHTAMQCNRCTWCVRVLGACWMRINCSSCRVCSWQRYSGVGPMATPRLSGCRKTSRMWPMCAGAGGMKLSSVIF